VRERSRNGGSSARNAVFGHTGKSVLITGFVACRYYNCLMETLVNHSYCWGSQCGAESEIFRLHRQTLCWY